MVNRLGKQNAISEIHSQWVSNISRIVLNKISLVDDFT